jgi:hypothetical protein
MSARRNGLAVAMLVALVACGGSGAAGEAEWVTPVPAAEEAGSAISIAGVVTHVDLEGGYFAIRGEDGVTYDPTNLPPAFQKDGLKVEVEARRRDDMMGVHQGGPIVQIVRIRAR